MLNITTQDEDSGYNAAMEIFLDDPSLPFYLGDASTKLPVSHSYGSATVLTNHSLDYEAVKLYLVKVRVTDMAGCIGTSCQVNMTMTS